MGLGSNFRLCGQSWLPEEMAFELKITYLHGELLLCPLAIRSYLIREEFQEEWQLSG